MSPGFGVHFNDAPTVTYERPAEPFDATSRRLITREHTPEAGLYHCTTSTTDYKAAHPETRIFFALEGRGSLTIDGTLWRFEPGDAVLAPAGSEIRHVATEEQTYLIFWTPASSGHRGHRPSNP